MPEAALPPQNPRRFKPHPSLHSFIKCLLLLLYIQDGLSELNKIQKYMALSIGQIHSCT